MKSLRRIILIGCCLCAVGARMYATEKKVVQERAFVVDVCTPWEFRQNHYPDAVNIPLDEIDMRIQEFGQKKQPIIVYCSSGMRAEVAKEKLEEMGFTNVKNGGSLDGMLKKPKPEDALKNKKLPR